MTKIEVAATSKLDQSISDVCVCVSHMNFQHINYVCRVFGSEGNRQG